jgi:hypothetical protein
MDGEITNILMRVEGFGLMGLFALAKVDYGTVV